MATNHTALLTPSQQEAELVIAILSSYIKSPLKHPQMLIISKTTIYSLSHSFHPLSLTSPALAPAPSSPLQLFFLSSPLAFLLFPPSFASQSPSLVACPSARALVVCDKIQTHQRYQRQKTRWHRSWRRGLSLSRACGISIVLPRLRWGEGKSQGNIVSLSFPSPFHCIITKLTTNDQPHSPGSETARHTKQQRIARTRHSVHIREVGDSHAAQAIEDRGLARRYDQRWGSGTGRCR